MVFLTGGTGLLGIRILYDLITNGVLVNALKRKNSDLSYVREAFRFYDPENGQEKFAQIQWYDGDVLDLTSLKTGMADCNEVYHAAAMVSFRRRDRKQMLETNIEGTANVVNLALELGISKFCHISSIAALGRSGNNAKVSENDLWANEGNPSFYSISKYYSEMEVWRAIEEGLNAVILNPSLILGAGRPDISSGKIYSSVWNGLKVIGPNSNSIIDARTISQVALQLMKEEVWRERFILSAWDLPSKELFILVADALEKRAPEKVLSNKTIKSAAYILKFFAKLGIEGKISYETISGALMNYSYDNSKLSRFVEVDYPSAKDSIQYYADYYKKLLSRSN